MVRGEIPWTGQGRPGNGGEIFERGSKLVHKSLWSGVLGRSDQSQSLTKRCAFVWRSLICLWALIWRTGSSLGPRFSVIFGVFGIWGYPHEGQLFPWCPPLGHIAMATASVPVVGVCPLPDKIPHIPDHHHRGNQKPSNGP